MRGGGAGAGQPSVLKQVVGVRGGFWVEGNVFNACFILCFLRRENEDNARLLRPLGTLFADP